MNQPRDATAGLFGFLVLAALWVPWTPTTPQGATVALAAGDGFGYASAIDGDTTVLGAPTDDTTAGANAGSASVFVRSGTQWTGQAKLIAPDGAADEGFGRWVDISANTAVISAPSHSSSAGPRAGAVYVFVRSGTDWSLEQELIPADAKPFDLFGRSVAVSGDTIVVGSPFHDTAAGRDAGAAYVYVRSGGDWSLQEKITPPDGAINDRFGHAVDIDVDTVVVGAPLDDTTSPRKDAGSAYVFFRPGATWSTQAKLVAPDRSAQDHFGRWVTVDGDVVGLGSPGDDLSNNRTDAGSAHLFVRSGSTWSNHVKLTAPAAMGGDAFGFRLEINGDTLAVGAPDDDTAAGSNAGSAFIFTRSGTTWTLQLQLFQPGASATDQFGRGVAVSGETLIVGAPYDDNATGIDAGSAFAFVRSGTNWTLQATLIDPL